MSTRCLPFGAKPSFKDLKSLSWKCEQIYTYYKYTCISGGILWSDDECNQCTCDGLYVMMLLFRKCLGNGGCDGGSGDNGESGNVNNNGISRNDGDDDDDAWLYI